MRHCRSGTSGHECDLCCCGASHDTRDRSNSDGNVDEASLNRLAEDIEAALFSALGYDMENRYKAKVRSILFNLKDPRNDTFYRHIRDGTIAPSRLPQMDPQDMANEELANFRRQQAIQLLERSTLESAPADASHASGIVVLANTHKGELVIERISQAVDEPLSVLVPSLAAAQPPMDTSRTIDAPGREPERDMDRPVSPDSAKRPRTSALSDDAEEGMAVQRPSQSPSPWAAAPAERSPSPHSPPSPPPERLPVARTAPSRIAQQHHRSVWKGELKMQTLATVSVRAVLVPPLPTSALARDPAATAVEQLQHVMPSALMIHGRIQPAQVEDYLDKLKASRTRQLCVMLLQPAGPEHEDAYLAMHAYFDSRSRYGVVGNCFTAIKDMYVVPISARNRVPDSVGGHLADAAMLTAAGDALLAVVIMTRGVATAVRPHAPQPGVANVARQPDRGPAEHLRRTESAGYGQDIARPPAAERSSYEAPAAPVTAGNLQALENEYEAFVRQFAPQYPPSQQPYTGPDPRSTVRYADSEPRAQSGTSWGANDAPRFWPQQSAAAPATMTHWPAGQYTAPAYPSTVASAASPYTNSPHAARPQQQPQQHGYPAAAYGGRGHPY